MLSTFWVVPVRSPSTPLIDWVPYTEGLLSQTGGKPVLADIYADWCIPCKEMEFTTFRHPHVVEHAKQFLMVKVDVTNPDNPDVTAFLKRYHVVGVPMLLAFDRQGAFRRDVSKSGYVSAQDLLALMSELGTHDLFP